MNVSELQKSKRDTANNRDQDTYFEDICIS